MTASTVAVIGMACRYPDAQSPDDLWDNVLAQRRAFRRLPPERLRLQDYVAEFGDTGDTFYSTQAALLEGYEFDRTRFRVPASVFRAVDPAHWLALDVAAEALEDAGFSDGQGLPRESTGVLVGNTLTGEFSRANLLRLRWPYVRRTVDAALDDHDWTDQQRTVFLDHLESKYKSPFPPPGDESLAGGLSNTIAGRICNYFDLKGGGYTVDAACASSLLAIATACSSLVAGDLDVAVAGGVDLSLDPFELVGFAKLGALAAEEMRVYDARSAGFWPGEGCGFVILMRYEDARSKGLTIHCLLRGWGVSSDGSGGITRPEVEGQRLALCRAYRRAGFGIETVPYFEGHGTGTTVGDLTELLALSRTRHEAAAQGPPATIGSVKANIGHTKAAAGVAGLIKAAMALKYQILPSSTGWEQPHPVLAEEGHELQLLKQGKSWPADQPLRAGVSAMGFGGINVHIALESIETSRRKTMEARHQSLLSTPQDAELFMFGAADTEALGRQIERTLAYAACLSRSELTDLSAALAGQIEGDDVRCAVVASSSEELEDGLNQLESWIADGISFRLDSRRGLVLSRGMKRAVVGFLFPGQGSPANLGGGIWLRRFPFIQTLIQASGFPAKSDGIATDVAQPAIVAASIAGLHILKRLGIDGAVAIGHSLGELSAYHWAGAIDGPALLRIATSRGRAVMDFGSPGGAMASIAAGPTAVEALRADDGVVVAGWNAPGQTVVSGKVDAVEAMIARARARGIAAIRLPVSHAFHSPLVAASVSALAEAVNREDFGLLRESVASTVTGGLLDPDQDLRGLLLRQMTSPVRFMQAVDAVAGRADLWIEVGPGHVLGAVARGLVKSPIVSLDVGSDSLQGLLLAFGTAFAMGAPVESTALWKDRFTRPFELDWQPRFLINPCELAPKPRVADPPTGRDTDRAAMESPPTVSKPVRSEAAPLEVVRHLVARYADLPVSAVSPDDRLLNEFHFSSLLVGQLVAEAARTMGTLPPISPTDSATATVREIADLLDELAKTPAVTDREQEPYPTGVDLWVRPFTVDLVLRPLTARPLPAGSTSWEVICPQDYPYRDAVQRAFSHVAGSPGVVVALPAEPDEGHIQTMLKAAGAVFAGAPDGRFTMIQHGGGGAAFARSLAAELPQLTTCVVDLPWGEPQTVDWARVESQNAHGYVEAHYDRLGQRREPRLRLLSLPDPDPALPLDSDDVLLVSGGGKGIAAECAFHLAAQTGVRLAVLGRSDPCKDEQLADNLQRLASTGVRLEYCIADVTDSHAVRAAVQRIEYALGPVTAVLHAAGFNKPQRLDLLTREDFLRTLRPKLDGARNVLSAIEAERVRLLITFGSIIARTGMHGQADYAVANEWLTQLTERWQKNHPNCHCVAVEWSVWTGVGMGERLGTLGALKQQGISPIRPDDGVRMLQQILGGTLPAVSVVVSGRFGQPRTVKFESPGLALWRFIERPRIHIPGVEMVVEADLSEDTDPYLRDHVYQGVPLLPAVMGLEAMAQVAMAVTGSQDLPSFKNARFQQPVVVSEGVRCTIRIAALVQADGRVELVLRSQETGFQVDHFCATCHWQSAAGIRGRSVEFDSQACEVLRPLPRDVQSGLYGGFFFQSGRFRRLGGYRHLTARTCVAEITSAVQKAWFAEYLPRNLLLGDAAARDAAIHAIGACIPNATLLPVRVESLAIRQPLAAPARMLAKERSCDGDTFIYDMEVIGEDGTVLEQWVGLQLRRVSSTAPSEQWPTCLLGPYMERRLEELIPGTTLTIVVDTATAGDPLRQSDRAILRAAGTSGGPVYRRADGRPELCCGPGVSAAHAGDLTIAIAGSRAAACDVEPLVVRPADMWKDLLVSERYQLAELITGGVAEDRDTAATRVWSASECLKKAGRDYDMPLTFQFRTDDDWVVLAAGPLRVATWVGPVRGRDEKLVFAICVES